MIVNMDTQDTAAYTRESLRPYDVAEEEVQKEKSVPFPHFMFSAALFKDVLDTADLTGVGVVLTTITSFVIGAIIFIWTLGKLGIGGTVNSKRGYALMLEYTGSFLIELVPVIKMSPTWSLFVLYVWYQQKKDTH